MDIATQQTIESNVSHAGHSQRGRVAVWAGHPFVLNESHHGSGLIKIKLLTPLFAARQTKRGALIEDYPACRRQDQTAMRG
jgi:hypothetical protein